MANIRIKDLANTASSTASDDFLGVDGATNGTRKLNGYSPSFGGNATVGGTLTVNGGTQVLSASGGSDSLLVIDQIGTAASYLRLQSAASPASAYGGIEFKNAGSTRWFIGGQGGYVNSAHDFNVTVNGDYRFRIDTAGVSRVLSTTASTSTSSGALVVGNGSSGGLGVAGAAYIGGKAVINGGDASAAQFAVASASGTLVANLTAGSTTNQSFGMRMFAGTSSSDYGLFVRNVTDTTTLFKVDGVGGTTVGGNLTVSGTTGVTATDLVLGTSGPSAKSSIAARAARQGLVFDGSANGSTFTLSSTIGTGDFTIVAWAAPASTSGTQQIVTSASGNGGMGIASGALRWYDSTGGSKSFTPTFTAGKMRSVVLVRSGATITSYADGVAGDTHTSAHNLDQTAWSIGRYGGGEQFTGRIGPVLIYNRALSASEVVALYEAGAPSAADHPATAAGTTVNTSSWVNNNYSTFSSANGATLSATYSGSGTQYAYAAPTFVTKYANVIRFYYDLTLTSGQLPYVVLTEIGVKSVSATANLAAGAGNYVDLLVNDPSSATTIAINNTSSSSWSIANAKLVPLGLLLAPDAAQAGNGYVWNDQSGNLAQIVLPSSGVAWNLPSIAGNRIRGTTSTNGNQQLLGASTLLPAECQITHVRARARSGTPTITIGTASGGAQIVASVALSTTWLNCTIALTGGIVSSADDIWVGSNSTAVVETDIAFQPLDF